MTPNALTISKSGSFCTDWFTKQEHFDCGPADDTEYPNQWPSESALPGFRPFAEKTYEDLQRSCLQVIEAMEIGLALPLQAPWLTGARRQRASFA